MICMNFDFSVKSNDVDGKERGDADRKRGEGD